MRPSHAARAKAPAARVQNIFVIYFQDPPTLHLYIFLVRALRFCFCGNVRLTFAFRDKKKWKKNSQNLKWRRRTDRPHDAWNETNFFAWLRDSIQSVWDDCTLPLPFRIRIFEFRLHRRFLKFSRSAQPNWNSIYHNWLCVGCFRVSPLACQGQASINLVLEP